MDYSQLEDKEGDLPTIEEIAPNAQKEVDSLMEKAEHEKEKEVKILNEKETNDTLSASALEEAKGKYLLGKSALYKGDVNVALDLLEEALAVYVAQHGDIHLENADLYFQYGSALLELAKQSDPLLVQQQGFGDDQNESRSSSDEDEDDEDEGDDESDSDEDEGVKAVPPENPEEAVDNLQLAWENLECARLIYETEAKVDARLKPKLGDSHEMLGNVFLEQGAFAEAASEFENALNVRMSIEPLNHREVALAHFNVGLAHQFDKRFDAAIAAYQNAQSIILDKIAASSPEEKEELEAIVKDLVVKIEDAREEQKTTPAEELPYEEGFGTSSSSSSLPGPSSSMPSSSSSSFPTSTSSSTVQPNTLTPENNGAPKVNDLSSLVRKTKPAASMESASKKLKLGEE